MPETVIDAMYKQFNELISFLDDAREISMRSLADNTFKKTLALSAASFFEDQIRGILLEFVEEKASGDEMIKNFVKNKAISRQYHTFFDWRGKNANKFFSLFGDEFKQRMSKKIKSDGDLDNSVRAFLDIGNTRNELAHLNFASIELDKTADEVYNQFKTAMIFIQFVKDNLLNGKELTGRD